MSQHQSSAVLCRTCGHGYDGHAAGGGPCTRADSPSTSSSSRCPCSGFRWIDPRSPATGPYTAPPVRPA